MMLRGFLWRKLHTKQGEEYAGTDKDRYDEEFGNLQPNRQDSAQKGGSMTKAFILYHVTENIVNLEKKEVKDGNITIGDKSFDVDGFKPKMIKRGFGYMPLYMLKWDTINPPTDFNPTFKPDKDITPEIYHKTMKMKILGNMLKLDKGHFNVWMVVAIGIAFGIFVAYYLFSMGIIKI
jgi:hypothetical protein